ncbi:hypothetical protein NIES3806_40300 [Microcystis aeruginosa NIES-3806]|uniref:Uncharacterized protein n=1 Tax=Microcystis aeruginosa NIES-3807 TaxID=2517785 RepID=A0AAD3G9A9_MICAE|nr:hypothetical protein NIES3806_40300 [Microcystis aeruginosa NIES-3806]GCL58838.1 hypothetical protein NIES3807_20080 [Microcystis aeruginosa NIES-3807]
MGCLFILILPYFLLVSYLFEMTITLIMDKAQKIKKDISEDRQEARGKRQEVVRYV